MKQPLYNTGVLFKTLIKRDWFKLVFWILGMLAFAASGAGKMEVASNPATASTLYTMFVKNPAMVGLFGPTPINNPTNYSLGPIFGQTMTLITGLTFAIISIIYVVNRSRKEEDDGITELFRSYSIGKLANTTALVMELLLLNLIMAVLLALSIEVQNVAGLNHLESNFLFAFTTSAQGFLWGMFALLFGQIFSEASTTKGMTFGLLGLLYIVRMLTDVTNLSIGWFNPLSWSYLAFPYVKGHENWLAVFLTFLLAFLILGISYILELKRDVGVGYLPERKARLHGKKGHFGFPGLVLNLEKKMIIGWLLASFVLGLVYGSMFGQMDQFISSNKTVKELFVGNETAASAIRGNFMVTLFSILSILIAAFGVILLTKMVSEERKNRLEALYALPLSRLKVYSTYLLIAILSVILAQFLSLFGIFIEQLGNKNALSFLGIMKSGMIWLVAVIFVLAILSLLLGLVPRLAELIWVYLAFLLFMTYLGKLLSLPKWLENLSIYNYIPKLPVEKMNLPTVLFILILSVFLVLLGFGAYRRRDLITG
ncbi:ABC transporter permease [Lactococcus lactis]|uniref:ABC transporter permease n=1 Tax=Lactococcus lactis TaxID=1358 RepID=UPI00071D7E04|nr:ABC transporter permease [Lactococcus lactis]MRM48164.1 ABC transporter permease [Lactococcus cremoris]ARE00953.1 ABC transporter permease protein [Lactococcus lactis subsp. lactis]ARE03339.1 ABC transporter permease protein [Lactococcus lactis subsp. lactis]KSU29394.1 ABC transporter permease protein [Lactococcus lactis subsp. lactis]MCT3109981.1 ABC transporter permease [Lactococcus lactis]